MTGGVASRPSAARSIRFAPAPKPLEAAKGEMKVVEGAAPTTKQGVSRANRQIEEKDAGKPLPETKQDSAISAGPPFGAMLPVRLMGVLYTLRAGALARLELVRDLKAGHWQLKRGTVFAGSVIGSDLDRAYLQLKGYVDAETGNFVRLEGETLGSDGGAGLRGKRRRISPAWVKVLDRAAQSGVQLATGILNRRNSSVIVSTDPYGTYRSASGQEEQTSNNRAFVEVPAGTAGFVMVTTLPEPGRPNLHPERSDTTDQGLLTDTELAELFANADPEMIRAALPRLNHELRRVAQTVLKEIEAGAEKR